MGRVFLPVVVGIWAVSAGVVCATSFSNAVSLWANSLKTVRSAPENLKIELDGFFGDHNLLSTIYDDTIYSQARSILGSLRDSSSCSRLATAGLLQSCEDLTGPEPSNTPKRLDQIRSIYAARIAVCELLEAAAEIPDACMPLMPRDFPPERYRQPRNRGRSGTTGDSSGSSHDERPVGKAELGQCLKSLEGRPQWWTSYSNGRQNAIVLCQAVQSEIEKDDLLNLHERATEVTSSLHAALANVLQTSQQQAASQSMFFESLRKSQDGLFKNLDDMRGSSQDMMSKTTASMDALTEALADNVARSNAALEMQFEKLNKGMEESSSNFELLEKSGSKIFRTIIEGSVELAAKQSRDWETSNEFAAELKTSLELMKTSFVDGLLASLATIRGDLSQFDGIAGGLQHRQLELEAHLERLDTAFGQIEIRADVFQTSQQAQEDQQTRLLELLRLDLSEARSVLVDMASSADMLHSSVVQTSQKFQAIQNFDIPGNSVGSWAGIIIALIGVSFLDRAIIGWIVVGAGLFLWLFTSGLIQISFSAALRIIGLAHACSFTHRLPGIIVFIFAAIALLAASRHILTRLYSRVFRGTSQVTMSITSA